MSSRKNINNCTVTMSCSRKTICTCCSLQIWSRYLFNWPYQFPGTSLKLKKKPYLHLKRPPTGRPSRKNVKNPSISNLRNRTSILGHYWKTAKIYLLKSLKCTRTRSSIVVRCVTLFLRVTRITERLCASRGFS